MKISLASVSSTLALTLLLSGCSMGSFANESDCAQAVAHLDACGMSGLPSYGACTPTKASYAREILGTDCAGLAGRSISSSSCGSLWDLFKPSCWGSDDDNDKNDPYKSGNGMPCSSDDDCQSGQCADEGAGWRCTSNPQLVVGSSCTYATEMFCPSNTICHQGACRGLLGYWCDMDSDCVSGNCEASLCASKSSSSPADPSPSPGDGDQCFCDDLCKDFGDCCDHCSAP